MKEEKPIPHIMWDQVGNDDMQEHMMYAHMHEVRDRMRIEFELRISINEIRDLDEDLKIEIGDDIMHELRLVREAGGKTDYYDNFSYKIRVVKAWLPARSKHKHGLGDCPWIVKRK